MCVCVCVCVCVSACVCVDRSNIMLNPKLLICLCGAEAPHREKSGSGLQDNGLKRVLNSFFSPLKSSHEKDMPYRSERYNCLSL